MFTDAVFVFQEQKQEETGAAKDDRLELKTWKKHTESCEDDTEVTSRTHRSLGLASVPVSPAGELHQRRHD